MMNERPYDIILFGATGFTGRLAADYLAGVQARTPLRWALAGRSRSRLEQVRASLAEAHPGLASLDLFEASSDDASALGRIARAARVVLTTVGPYAQHGEPLVAACVREGADYVDITGEPRFVNKMIARYDAPAREAGVRIVHCCGFDSIPHDLGALFTVDKLPQGEPVTIEAFVRSKGNFSGGTWQSAISELAARGSLSDKPSKEPLPDGRVVRGMPQRLHYDRELGGWVCPLPTIDPQIVLRSARTIDRYGPDFRYGHNMLIRSTATLALGAIGIGALLALVKIPPARALLQKVKSSGEGPSAEERERSWFQVLFRGTSGARRVKTRVSGGDPGYTETAKMVSEAALCLALDRDSLPPRAGVLTPAAAMGGALITRLQSAGIRFELLEG